MVRRLIFKIKNNKPVLKINENDRFDQTVVLLAIGPIDEIFVDFLTENNPFVMKLRCAEFYADHYCLI